MIRALWPTELIARRRDFTDGGGRGQVGGDSSHLENSFEQVGDRFFNEGFIRRRETVRSQFGWRYPSAGLAFEVLDFAGLVLADERMQADGGVGVVVLDGRELRDRAGADGEFFAKLAFEALLEGFVGLALAAGELPVAAEFIVALALADEHLPGAADDGDGGIDPRHGREFSDARADVKAGCVRWLWRGEKRLWAIRRRMGSLRYNRHCTRYLRAVEKINPTGVYELTVPAGRRYISRPLRPARHKLFGIRLSKPWRTSGGG